MLFRIAVFAFVVFGALQPATALRFYVDPVHGDNRRSVQSAQDSSTAFKTITHALRIAHIITEGRPHLIEIAPGPIRRVRGKPFRSK